MVRTVGVRYSGRKHTVARWCLASGSGLGREFHSLGPSRPTEQRTSEGHMSSDGTTARRADDQRRSVDDVSVPSREPEHSWQLDTVARYR